MSSRKRNSLIMLIIAAVLGVALIISLILLILQRTGGIDQIRINAQFSDMELDINQEYMVTITTEPEGADAEKFEYLIDSSAATFEYYGENTGVIRTIGAGEVTIKVKYKGKESNSITFSIVDKADQQRKAEELAAQQQAELEQQQMEEAAAEEEAQVQVTYVKVTATGTINVRTQPDKGSDPAGTCKNGDTFEVIEDNGEWTKVKFGGGEGWIRNDLIETVQEGEEATPTAEAAPAPTEPKKEEAKKEEKTEEQKKAEDEAKKAADAEAAAKAAEDELKKQQEAAQKAAEEALAQQQAAAAAAAAAGPVPVWSYGGRNFSAAEVQIFKNNWGGLEGGWEEWAKHHPAGELKTLCINSGVPESQMCP